MLAEEPSMKLVIVSHALVIPVFRRRWQRLAEHYPVEVHLLVPKYWEQSWFGEKVIYRTESTAQGRFHIHALPTTSVSNWSRYLFKSIDANLREIQPDIIYIVHEEGLLIHQQIYWLRNLFCRHARVMFFSMNARGVPHTRVTQPIKRWLHYWMWQRLCRNTEAAVVHYPGCLQSLRDGGYTKPIFIQTQVGVDETLFQPDIAVRQRYRQQLGCDEAFVIGFAGRLTADKGVDDLFAVFTRLALQHKQVHLLLVGNGDLKAEIEAQAQQSGIAGRLHITGFVDQAEVPGYMNAMDLFVLGSRTTPHWIDTFPLVTVQAQACGIPVIASDSASIPWQLEDTALLFAEGDRAQLEQAVLTLYEDTVRRSYLSEVGRKRALSYFCHQGMTENFYRILQQVAQGEFTARQESDPYIQWKAYL